MKNTSLFTPVERIDGLSETRNTAEKHMHLYRYRHAAALLHEQWKEKGSQKKILDIACGYGYGSRELHLATKARVKGMDISDEAVKYARTKYTVESSVTYSQGSITSIPSPDSTYDAIVCYETIEHVSYDEGTKALSELYRVLKPGGTLFISTPNRVYTYMLQLMGFRNPFHLYEYMPRELQGLLKKQGFEIIASFGQSICFPVTYYLARNGLLPSGYFYPSSYVAPELSMIAIIMAVKEDNISR